MTRKIVSLFALLMLLFAGGMLQAKDAAPFAQISIASYNTLDANAGQLSKMLDNPQLAIMVKMLDAQMGDDLMGVFDKTKPIGVELYYYDNKEEEDLPVSFKAFLPISDQEPLLNKLAEINEDLNTQDDFEFENVKMTQISFDEQKVYMVTANGWTFLSDKPALLVKLAKNPDKSLGDMPSKYTLGVQLNMDNVPEEIKKWCIEQIESGMSAAEDDDSNVIEIEEDDEEIDEEDEDEESDSTSDEDADEDEVVEDDEADSLENLKAIQKAGTKTQMAQLKMLFYEVKTLIIGIGLNSEKETLYFDAEVTAVDGSNLAKTINLGQNASLFTNAILKDATVYGSSISGQQQMGIDSAKELFPLYKKLALDFAKENLELGDAQLKDFDALLDRTVDLGLKSMEAVADKAIATGAAFFFKPDNVSVVTAVKGMSTDGYDALIKDWVKFIAKDADYLKGNTETWNGLTFNVATIPTAVIIDKINEQDEEDADEETSDEDDDEEIVEDEDEEIIEDEDEIDTNKEFCKWLQDTYGDNIEIAYAVGDDVIYFAVAKDAVALIKKTCKNKDAEVPPEGKQGYQVFNLQEFLGTLAKMPFIEESTRDTFDAVATAAAGEDNQSKIYAFTSFGDNKAGSRIEVEKGVLRATMSFFMLMSMGM